MLTLEEAIVYLRENGKKTQSQLKEATSIIRKVAESEGLDTDIVASLMLFVVKETDNNGVSVVHRCQILRTLIPKTVVTLSTVLAALGAMGSQPLSLKKLLFQWIVLVYDIIDGRGTTLHTLYDVILYYIQYDEIRSVVCQLLCYLTRREDVRVYRVQRLTEVQEQVLVSKEASESGFIALLTIYKRYCPHLVKLSCNTRRKSWFKPFEKKLAANILRVQSLRSPRTSASTASSVSSQLVSLPPPAKRSKITSTIPALQPSHLHSRGDSDSRVSVAQLSSLSELCSNIDNLELPGQMATVLESRLCRHAFCLNPDPSTVCRLTYWLQYSLGYELDRYAPGGVESSALLHMLSCLKTLTEFILEPIPVVESFLSILLEVWNGEDYQSEVCGLLEHLSLQQFSELEGNYLDPIKALFQAKDLMFRRLILTTLTALFRNMIAFEWPRNQRKVGATDAGTVTWSLFHNSSLLEDEDSDMDFDPRDTLRHLTNCIGDMTEFALREDHAHPLIQHTAVSFYEIVTDLPGKYGIPLVCVPRPFVVFNLLLSLDASALDRMLGCFVSCKRSFTSIKKEERGVEDTHTFNSTVLDLCDALWKNCAFSSKHRPYPTLLFKLSNEQLSSCGLDNVSDKLSMIHHPAFLGFVLKFFKETQDPNTHFQPQAIWQEERFRFSYLDYLHHCHLTGIGNFIKHFIR